MRLTGDEFRLLHSVLEHQNEILEEVTRKSDKQFDLRYESSRKNDIKASAWLPLALIRCVDWPKLAHMSDYPEMVAEGDWSGIRDSSEETIWAMFHHVRDQISRFRMAWSNSAI